MESIQMVLLMLAASAISCGATSEPMTDAKEKVRILHRIGLIGGYFHDTDVEPPVASGQNTTVTLRMHVLCADVPEGQGDNRNIVRISGWLFMSWKDARLSWDPTEYNGIDKLRVSTDRIWKPDLRLYTAGDVYQTGEVKAALFSGGTVFWVPPVRAYIPCLRQDDDAITNCTMKMGSWSYSADVLDIQPSLSGFVDISDDYSEPCPSVVMSHEARRNLRYYECCPDQPFVDIEINLAVASR